MADPGPVVGLDGCKGGWVAATLRGRRLELAEVGSLEEALGEVPDAKAFAIDMPMGWPREQDGWRRRVDGEVRRRLGRQGSRIFSVPPEAAMKQASYPEALATCRAMGAPGLSKQVWNLRTKILELEEFAARRDVAFLEVHPEWVFRVMAATPRRGKTRLPSAGDPAPPGLAASKKTWIGLRSRLDLLAAWGLEPGAELAGGSTALSDDVVDAVACSWTARRWVAGHARALPADAASDEATIWA